MKKHLFAVLLFSLSCLTSCSLSPASPPEWKLQQDGIILHFEADNQLNLTNGKAYTLYVALYQLGDPNSFNQLTEDEEGLSKLLESKVFDASVASVKNMIIYPGSDVTYKMERAEGARYLGVVAGYGVMAKERITRLFEVPVYVKKESMFSFSKKLVPGQL